MKTEDMVEAVVTAYRKRKALGVNPATRNNWGLCMKCGRELDSVNTEDMSNNTIEIRVTHHGEEDYAKFRFPSSEYREEHVNMCLRSVDWFMQNHSENSAKKR